MKKIFAGLILVLLDFNLNFDIVTVGLLPDFIGFMLIAKGLSEVEGSTVYSKLKFFVTAMIAYSAVLYAMDLFGISSAVKLWITVLLSLVSLIMTIGITYFIASGIKELERNHERNYFADRLKACWTVFSVCRLASFALYFVRAFWITSIALGIVGAIFYLAAFYKTYRAYRPPYRE